MTRRGFLAALTAPLVAAATLDEVARYGWKRKFFPGWSPPKISSLRMAPGSFELGDIIEISGLDPRISSRYVITAIAESEYELCEFETPLRYRVGLVRRDLAERIARPVGALPWA